MMRATWRGNFRLGELVMPVKLYSAIRTTEPDFVQVHKSDMAPVRRQTICSIDGQVLSADEVTKAINNEGTYIDISDIDIAEPHVERDIIVRQFATINHGHTLYYDKPYYLAPETGGEAAYAILRNGLRKANKIAVVTYSLYGRAHIGIIGPTDGVMVLQQLKYASELIGPGDVKMRSLPQPTPKQIELAVELIEKYSTEFYLEDYRNEQLDSITEIIERSKKGLRPKKQKQLPSDITPEKELTSTFKHLLEGNGSKLT